MTRAFRRALPLLLSLAVLLPGAARAQQPTGGRHALIIGISDYAAGSGLEKLRFTENDAEDLADLLKKGGFTGLRVLTSTRGKKKDADLPNAANIRKGIKDLLARKTRRDMILVALAGHGVTVNDESYFCPADANPNNPKTLVSMKQLLHDIDDCGAGVNLLLVDACRNDPKAGRSVNADTLPRLPRGTAALFSCMSGERAYETDKLPGGRGHGIFFHHVLEGLKGKGKNESGEITWSRLSDYVTSAVSDDAIKIVGGGYRQTPEQKLSLTGKSPVLMRALNIDPPISVRNNPPVVPRKITPRIGSNAEALFRKALARNYGQGEKIDFTEAAQLYTQAAAEGSPPAGGFLGLLLAAGAGVEKDEAKARQHCTAALAWARPEAKKGNPTAQLLMGQMHERGLGVPKNEKVAAGWYRKAAGKGDLLAQTYLASLMANGKGVPKKDEDEAVRLYRQAAEKGIALAQAALGTMHLNGRGVPKKSAAEAARWYYEASKQNLPLGQSNLAFLLSRGQGVKPNLAEAVRLYKLAAEKNEPWAYTGLGILYAEGKGVEKNDAEAVRLYRKAADLGLAQAQQNMGIAHLTGQGGLPMDQKEAANWFRMAADQDHPAALTQLGNMYMVGAGVPKSEAEGVRLIRKGADLGNPVAQLLVGAMHEEGDHATKDVNEARKWYQKAAAQGNAAAKERLAKLK
jgi:TPR repeat protein